MAFCMAQHACQQQLGPLPASLLMFLTQEWEKSSSHRFIWANSDVKECLVMTGLSLVFRTNPRQRRGRGVGEGGMEIAWIQILAGTRINCAWVLGTTWGKSLFLVGGWAGGFLVNRRKRANKYQLARNSIYSMVIYSYWGKKYQNRSQDTQNLFQWLALTNHLTEESRIISGFQLLQPQHAGVKIILWSHSVPLSDCYSFPASPHPPNPGRLLPSTQSAHNSLQVNTFKGMTFLVNFTPHLPLSHGRSAYCYDPAKQKQCVVQLSGKYKTIYAIR